MNKIASLFQFIEKRPLILFIGFFLIALLIYLPALKSGFIMDDYLWLSPLSEKQSLSLFHASWGHGQALRPIVRLWFFAQYRLFGIHAIGWHIVNILLHSLVTTILFFLLKKETNQPGTSLFFSLLFLVFPSLNENVAWISGQTHLLGLLFCLGAMHFSLQYRKKYLNLISCLIFTLLAYLTYEVSFVLPLAMWVYLFFIKKERREAIYTFLLLFLPLFIVILYRFFLFGNIGAVNSSLHGIALQGMTLNAYHAILAATYSLPLKGSLLIVGILGLLYQYMQTKRLSLITNQHTWVLIFPFLWYLPFIRVDGVAARFLYSSLFFTLLFMGIWMSSLPTKKSIQRMSLTFGWSCVFLICLIQTHEVANRYADVGSIYQGLSNEVQTVGTTIDPHTVLIFDHIPDHYQNIPAFISHFETFIRWSAHLPSDQLIVRSEKIAPPSLQKLMHQKSIVFIFHKNDLSITHEYTDASGQK